MLLNITNNALCEKERQNKWINCARASQETKEKERKKDQHETTTDNSHSNINQTTTDQTPLSPSLPPSLFLPFPLHRQGLSFTPQ